MSNEMKIHNVETGEITYRDLTEEELAKIQANRIEEETAKALKQTQKDELLARLGITQEEAKLLLA